MRTLATIAAVLFAAVAVCLANGSEDFPFRAGEKLLYTIYWGPFVAGHASLEVESIEAVDGHDCYHLLAKARTSGLVDFLFHVDSTTESWFDAKELCTRRYRQNRVEGKHAKHTETRYDYVHGQFTMTNYLDGTTCVLPLDRPLLDIVSAFFYVRTQPLELNKPQTFLVNAGDTNRLVRILPDQRKTIWTSPLGDVPALRVEPEPTITVVAANKGRMWIWISDDPQKLPLVLISKMPIGSARFQLAEIQTTNPALTQRLRVVSKD